MPMNLFPFPPLPEQETGLRRATILTRVSHILKVTEHHSSDRDQEKSSDPPPPKIEVCVGDSREVSTTCWPQSITVTIPLFLLYVNWLGGSLNAEESGGGKRFTPAIYLSAQKCIS